MEKHASMEGEHELGLQNGHPHTKQEATCLQYHVHAGLATEEDTRHRFHGVANLTNVM